jgi:hypothetical protein
MVFIEFWLIVVKADKINSPKPFTTISVFNGIMGENDKKEDTFRIGTIK